MHKRRRFLAISVGVIGLSGCTSDGGSGDSGNNEGGSSDGGSGGDRSLEDRYPDHYAIHEPTELVVMSDIEASADSFSVSVTGTVINGSDTDYDYAQIEFGLYDETGAKVGNALDNLSGLDAEQRWRFEAIGTGENASRWELDSMSAY